MKTKKLKTETKQQIVTRELTKLQKLHSGRVEAHHVLDAATPSTSPLHKYFEWDDSKAGHAHRLWQAQQLIAMKIQTQNLRLAGSRPPKIVPIRQRDLINVKPGTGYVSRSRVLASPPDRKEYVSRLIDELERWCEKAAGIAELDIICEGIVALLPPMRAKKIARPA
jgi:hypothetical protein